ncbi:MAG: Rrf2 family transcriptional regulator [bacterium]|nr:Rrf2 family transcriptional regulator [bacterium]
MKLLRKNTDYAIKALVSLAKKSGGYVSALDIANEQNIPYQFLRRILQDLIKNGFVASKKGANGGVKIIKNAKDIKVVDLIEIFQGNIEPCSCMLNYNLCENREECVLRGELEKIEVILKNEFAKLTIHKFLS